MISEPGPFLNTQITPDPIQETSKLRRAFVNSKRIPSLETQLAALKSFVTAESCDVKSKIE